MDNLFYIYLDNESYVYGFGSDPMGEFYVLVDSVPLEVTESLGCYQYIDGVYYEDLARLEALKMQTSAEREIYQLNTWFDWYDEQCMQYQRAMRLGTEFDHDINELDLQATANAARMKELKTILATPFFELATTLVK